MILRRYVSPSAAKELPTRQRVQDVRSSMPLQPVARTRNHSNRIADAMAMSRSSSWKEHRLANRLTLDGGEYSVDLVARKATGVEGWKMTLVYMPREAGAESKVDLPNAHSTADVRRTVRELEGAEDRLRELFSQRTQE